MESNNLTLVVNAQRAPNAHRKPAALNALFRDTGTVINNLSNWSNSSNISAFFGIYCFNWILTRPDSGYVIFVIRSNLLNRSSHIYWKKSCY